jgi:hypothetical protein
MFQTAEREQSIGESNSSVVVDLNGSYTFARVANSPVASSFHAMRVFGDENCVGDSFCER